MKSRALAWARNGKASAPASSTPAGGLKPSTTTQRKSDGKPFLNLMSNSCNQKETTMKIHGMLFVLTSMLGAAHAADVAGKWKSEFTSPIGQLKYIYDL